MASVQFAQTAGVPRIVRTSNPPDLSAFTMCCWVKISTYTNYIELFNVFIGTTSGYLSLEADGTGLLYVNKNQSPPNYDILNIDTNYTNWQFIALSSTGGTTTVYRMLQGDTTATTVGTILTPVITPIGMQFGDWGPSGGASDGTWKMAGVKVYNRALNSTQVATEATSFTPVSTSNLTFANSFQSASTCQVDQSGTGGDFTKTGTPTDSADSPTLPGGGGTTYDVDAGTDTPAVSDSSATMSAYARTASDTASVTDSSSRDAIQYRDTPGGRTTVFFID